MASTIEAASGAGNLEALQAQGKVVDDLCSDAVSSMVATGTTLVQIISEPSKPLAKLTMLHNIMESTEGPPNQPWHEVYAKIAGEMDAGIASFREKLSAEMARFEELAAAR